jgi:hypothetical protein
VTRIFAALASTLFAADATWHVRAKEDGILVETRSVSGSPFEELRLSVERREEPSQVCAAVWNEPGALERGFKRRDVLFETETERWSYEQISAPIVRDRDYTLHLLREPHGDRGCLIRFETTSEKGPPPQPGFVRVPVIRGQWDVSERAEGGTRVIYTLYSEPGGSIPAFLCRGQQRGSAVAWLRLILNRLNGQHP